MRNRAWRRSQRERVRTNRLERAKVLWSWSFRNDPEWLVRSALKWGKVNPFTQCSCNMCQYDYNKRFAPDIDEWEG